MHQVLVLNQDFSPLTTCSVERAFILVYLNKSEMLRSSGAHRLRTVNHHYPMPSVIRLRRYVHAPFREANLNRQNIFRRDNFECQYCGSKRDLTLDHVLPVSRGGMHTWLNLVTACRKCNTKKGDCTPDEISMNLKQKPFKPGYYFFLKDLAVRNEWEEFLQKIK